jgi:thiopeptide-type bacteriocin biosynthesis protein
MQNEMTWTYTKLYLGNALDRMDRLVTGIGRDIDRIDGLRSWFYIRYLDQDGIHVRLRAQGDAERQSHVRHNLLELCTTHLSDLHTMPASTYAPMVTAPGFEASLEQIKSGHNDVRFVEATYEPEFDKFGGEQGMPIAEKLFHTSSSIACDILDDEFRLLYSRKTLYPLLMQATLDAFLPQVDAKAYWREYAYYWLNGKSPAAEDWRGKFFRKADELQTEGVPVLAADPDLPERAVIHLERWRDELGAAAAAYRPLLAEGVANGEILCFNFAHLMNNRLGLAALEEAYMATLLEHEAAEP